MSAGRQMADISSHQATDFGGKVSIADYAASGRTHLLIKASEGTYYANPYFAGWVSEARRRGLHVGLYHYGKTDTPAAMQWGLVLDAISSIGGLAAGDWIELDLEDTSPPADEQLAAAWLMEWGRAAIADGYPHGVLYTYPDYAVVGRLSPSLLPPGWRRLHIADYSGTADADLALPPGWDRSQLWARQYSDVVSVPGVPGPCDDSRLIQEDDMFDAAAAAKLTELDSLMRKVVLDPAHPFSLQGLHGQLASVAASVAAIAGTLNGMQATINGLAGQVSTVLTDETWDRSALTALADQLATLLQEVAALTPVPAAPA